MLARQEWCKWAFQMYLFPTQLRTTTCLARIQQHLFLSRFSLRVIPVIVRDSFSHGLLDQHAFFYSNLRIPTAALLSQILPRLIEGV